ncbi:MAG: LytTR family DNA-binding domain-containing protein [Thermoanaerobaculia bacterium]|nr:LytTR family DNA-binding domain-containing protein [Thermoanaerobaculia bacterium]
MNESLRVLIVDDEPLARENLRRLLVHEPDVEIVAEAGDARGAESAIRQLRPDVVMLDVRIRESNGFEVLDRIEPDERPQVVFVSAHDEHAVRAFAVRAIDYLLKPIERPRLQAALERARDTVAARRRALEQRRPPRADAPDPRGAAGRLSRFVVRSVGKMLLIDVADVDWIEAAGNYVRLHHGGECHLLRETMTALEGRLDPSRFVRIHRSTIVNLDRVKELRHILHGDYAVILRDGTRLTLSRGFREPFGRVLESVTSLRISS